MIVKFERVGGSQLAKLLAFLHSPEVEVRVDRFPRVTLKSVKPYQAESNCQHFQVYSIDLEFKNDHAAEYFPKVHQIVTGAADSKGDSQH